MSVREIKGAVVWLRCIKCDCQFPVFEASGDADTDTIGIVSASKCNGASLAILEVPPIEWKNLDYCSIEKIELRFKNELQTDGYKVATFLGVEQTTLSAVGVSFDAFMKGYERPKVIYKCTCCDGRAIEKRRLAVEHFLSEGGEIKLLGDVSFGR